MDRTLDVVSRLRAWPNYHGSSGVVPSTLMREAADEIELLRVKLAEKTAEATRWHERWAATVEDANEVRHQLFLVEQELDSVTHTQSHTSF